MLFIYNSRDMDYIKNEMPSMDNIYNSDYYNQTKKYELDLANKSYEKSRNPFQTGVVPSPAYSDMFMETSEYNKTDNYIHSLSGNKIRVQDFKHGNMQQFLTKGITQPTDLNNNPNFIDKFGYNDFKIRKTEVENFFQPTTDTSYLRGAPDPSQFLLDRTNLTEKQNNYNPIQSIRVGPGLNMGFTSQASGGYQQSETRNFVQPKTKEELRPATDQRCSIFEIPVQGPIKNPIDKRGFVTPFAKNKPETVYKQTCENWFKGQSYLKKDTARPEENLKDTTRIGTHKDYYGPLKTQDEYINPKEDYGKKSIMVYNTEKHELAKIETPVANFTSIIKAVVAPITDALKITMKEYFIDSVRSYGNAVPQIPEKQTTYDPDNHIMRTTVKETTIHDSDNLNLTGNKETYSSLYDTAKTTTKETTIHDSEKLNLTGDKETYSSLYDNAKTTTKETTIHDSENLNLSGDKESYSALYDSAKTTTKETTIHDSDNLNLSGDRETYSSLYDNAKTTTKETTIHDSENLNLSGDKETYSGLYDNAKTTTKETTIHDTENLNLTGDKETYSGLYDNAKTTTKETTIHDNSTGNIRLMESSYIKNNDKLRTTVKQTLPRQDNTRNINNVRYKSTYVYDPSIVAKTTVKETTVNSNPNQFGYIGGLLNSIIGGYVIKEVDNKNTQRQYSHIEYNGGLKSAVTFIPPDREAEMNAEIDGTRELMQQKASEFKPNGAGNFKTVDKKDINMGIKRQYDIQETCGPLRNIGKIYQTTPLPITEDNITSHVKRDNAYKDRLDSTLLAPIAENSDIIKINPIVLNC